MKPLPSSPNELLERDPDGKFTGRMSAVFVKFFGASPGLLPIRLLTSSTILTSDFASTLIESTGTVTHTLPFPQAGLQFFFINLGAGIITIGGTINGNAAGYQLTNKYQYVEVTADGAQWLVTSNN